MRIGIDGRLWSQTGVGRYVRNLVFNLLKIDDKNSYVLFVLKKEENDIRNQISKFKIKNLKLKIVSTDIKWHSIREQVSFPGIISKENLDLVHFPYQLSIPVFYKRPYVITIHDLVRHHYITGRSSTNPYWLLGFKMLFYKILINMGARNAKKIIAVSNFTKNDIFDHLMVNKKNVEVIYESADDLDISNSKKPDLEKYFLFVGNVYQHKNADGLVKAFKNLVEKHDVKLVFVGNDDYFYGRLKKDVSKLVDKKQIIFTENTSDQELIGYYKNSLALVRPSFMEGFSLPPLEAFECGSLVLVSDIPVHREILGDNAIYFNPKDCVDMEQKMLYVLNLNQKEREKRINNGKELAKKFSWEKAARKTLEIYESSTSTSSV